MTQPPHDPTVPPPYPQAPAYGVPGYPQQPGYGPAPAYPQQFSRFDPNDPLISDDYAGWWRRSTVLLKATWQQSTLILGLFAIPVIVLLTPAQAEVQTQRVTLNSTATVDWSQLGSAFGSLGVLVLAALLAGALYFIGTLTTLRSVFVRAVGGRPPLGASLSVALRRSPAAFGWYLLGALLCLVSLLACLVPIFYVAAVLSMLPAVVLFERGNAISRSFQLFHADLGAALARILSIAGIGIVISVAGNVASTIVVTIFSLFQPTTNLVVDAFVATTLTSLASVVSGVLVTPLLLTTYADLRARREPFTTQMLLAEPPR